MPKQIDDQHVYQTTIHCLLTHGYAGATTKLIAEAAGINEVTLFRKYGSKAELVITAVKQQALHLQETDIQYSGNVQQDLEHILNIYLSSAKQHSQLFILILSEMARYPELHATAREPIGMLAKVGELLQRYQQEGVLRMEHPFHAVAALFGPIMVLTTLQRATTDINIPPLDVAAHVTAFVRGRHVESAQTS